MSWLAQERLDDEEKLWNAISWVPDLQCAWQISSNARDLIATISCGQCRPVSPKCMLEATMTA